MSTSSTTGAKLTWTPSALGGLFASTLIQRLHTSGWLTIAKLLTEAYATFTDTEARRNVAESYRLMVQDTFGGLSQTTAVVSATVPGTMMAVVSNQDPAINADISVKWPIAVGVPEDAQLVAAQGRYGRRLFRSAIGLGEEYDLSQFLRRSNTAGGVRGPQMWENVLTKYREGLPYLCFLDQFGNRKYVAAMVDKVDWRCNAEVDIPVKFVEVSDTPAVVTIS